MILDQDRSEDAQSRQWNMRSGMGILLILSGLGAAFGVLLEIYALFVSPQELAIFRQLFSDHVTINWQNGALSVPSEIVAYGVPIVLLSMAGGIAATLINGGINLLHRK